MANHPHNSSRPETAGVKLGVEIYRESGDIDPLYRALTPRQRRFAEEYIVDFNGTAAAIRAGYAKNYADRQAHILMRHLGVSVYLDHLSSSKESKITAIDPDYVIQRVTDIISKPEAKDGDRLRGLELLARHLGMFIDRTEITGKDGGAIEVEQRAREEAESFLANLKMLQDRADAKKDVKLI